MAKFQEDKNPHQTQFSVYILGAPGSGKTSVLKRYLEDKYEHEPQNKLTLTTPITKHSFVEGNISGQNLYDYYFVQPEEKQKLKGVILLYGIDKQQDLKYLLEQTKEIIEDQLFVKILVGNKSDNEEKRQIQRADALETASFKLGSIKYLECSARNGVGVQEVFKELQLKLLSKSKEIAQRRPDTSCCNLI